MEENKDLYSDQSKEGIAYRFELIRRCKALDKKEFSARLGIKPSTYSNILSGKNYPSIALIYVACREFGVDANYILMGDPSSLEYRLGSSLYNMHREASKPSP